MAAIKPATAVRHRFTAEDFERMGQLGILPEGAGFELIDGEVVVMGPIGARHAWVVDHLVALFVKHLPAQFVVRGQQPLRGLATHWEPQPDLVVQRGGGLELPTPRDAVLVVEVSETTVGYDRQTKVPAYALGEIPEVWVVDVTTDTIVVHRQPEGGRYTSIVRKTHGETVAPEVVPELIVSIDDILGGPQFWTEMTR
jgi:Uma2 family endonuclease